MRCDGDECVGEYVCGCAGGSVCGCLAIACMQFASLAVAGTD